MCQKSSKLRHGEEVKKLPYQTREMEAQKQVLHFQAKCGFTTAQSNEHQRRWTEKGWASANENGRIDRSRTHLNFEITKGGRSWSIAPVSARSVSMASCAVLK